MKHLITKTTNLRSGTPEEKRQEIKNYFLKTWEIDELLYTQLKSDEIFYHRGDPLRHILLFYLGHTAVFFINKLFLAKIIEERIDPAIESIFAIGVDEMSWDDLNERHYDWPEVAAVRAYRNRAKELILRVIDTATLTIPIEWADPFWIIMMGIEHERIHLETSSVLIRQLPLDEVVAGRFGEICPDRGYKPLQNDLLPVERRIMTLGKPLSHPFYGWDNEYGRFETEVPEFKTSRYLISNKEFLQFVEAEGYHREEYWTEEGWKWCSYMNAEMPLFWRKTGNDYRLRLVAEEIEMPWNWPVEVNYLEAKAFCNWKTAITGQTFRLPTEAEWYSLAQQCGIVDPNEGEPASGNLNLEQYASPCPVDRFKTGDFYDVTGNVWQWTETPITGFAGFNVHPMYDDFSTPTFDGQHNMIKGGSWISTGNEATLHARYAFRRHFYQHAGFRIVRSDAELVIDTDEYETDPEVTLSCEANWGDAFDMSPNFSAQLAQYIIETMGNDRTIVRVLDLNADTGRLAFELAPFFPQITAIDFSARFIRMPIHLQEKGFMRYIVKDEGEMIYYREVLLDDLQLGENKKNILFMQDNANNLKPIYTGYDLIIAPNLLEELICPILFLKAIHERLNENGLLLIASTYEWEINRVERKHWPGGYKLDGEPFTSFEGIRQILSENFELENEPFDLIQTIRKSSRLSEQRIPEVSVWRKK